MTESISFRGDKVKASLPKKLYQAIIRIQAEKDVDFMEACELVASLVDTRRNDFQKRVKVEADKLYKSKLMNQINKARKKISEKNYDQGHEDGYEDGHADGYDLGFKESSNRFKYYCSICYEPIPLSEKTWEVASKFLTDKGWGHASCHKKNN